MKKQKTIKHIMNNKELAKFMHDRYEYHSKRLGWNTQESCKVEFKDLPDNNKVVMLKVARDVINILEWKKNLI